MVEWVGWLISRGDIVVFVVVGVLWLVSYGRKGKRVAIWGAGGVR